MDTVVPTLRIDTSIRAAVSFLLQHRVTGAPVVDSDYKLLGILTEFDCLKLMSEGRSEDADVPTGVVGDYMTTGVVTGRVDMDIYYVSGIFLRNRFRRIPIVDADNRLCGAITRFDILRAIQAHLD